MLFTNYQFLYLDFIRLLELFQNCRLNFRFILFLKIFHQDYLLIKNIQISFLVYILKENLSTNYH